MTSARGPDEGWHTLPSRCQFRRSVCPGDVDDLENVHSPVCRMAEPKAGVRVNPKELSPGELQRLTRRYAAEILSNHRTEYRCPGS